MAFDYHFLQGGERKSERETEMVRRKRDRDRETKAGRLLTASNKTSDWSKAVGGGGIFFELRDTHAMISTSHNCRLRFLFLRF